MPSFKTAALLATAVLAFGAQAQLTYEIDPNSVPLSTRTTWCSAQLASCPLLCLQLAGSSSATLANTCDPASLDYTCTCGNGQAPNAGLYSQTIPYFECTQYGTQCVAACASHDSACQTACRVDNPCGAQSPNITSSTTSRASSSTSAPSSSSGTGNPAASTTSSSGAAFTSLGGGAIPTGGSSATDSTKKNGAQGAMDLAHSYGFTIVFAGLFAGFALVI